ncbi:MAG: hypothetical protein U5N86_07460 [Planctomycetota bacterium]|nr:hypothetical protein [Planctomycetota bacterium]
MLTFNIVEDITDGRFGKFDEDEVLFTVSEEDGHVLRIILDSVSAGIYNGKKFEMDGYIDSVEFDNIVGSFRNPEIRYTLSGLRDIQC